MGGDGMIADGTRIEIVSADRLAANLAGLFGSKRIVFATDVDGVFKHFPPRRGEKPLATLTRAELTGVRASRMKLEGDVTGGMAGKLAALTKLRGVTVIVCNGNKKGTLKTALRGGVVGTRITL
jgi:isopentenyl phosphate kinase